MQVRPDWTRLVTADHFNKEFVALTFKGPGFYLTAIDTMLVTPVPPNTDFMETVWAVEQPEGTLYEVNVYNVPYSKTIFGSLVVAPVRFDSR